MIVTEILRPSCESDVEDIIRAAMASDGTLAVQSGGSKSEIGKPAGSPVLEMAGLSGVVDYEPNELILKIRPGTLLSEVEALLASERQFLAFEPFDHGPLFGAPAGSATIGGVVGAGVAGSRRISAGAARDYVLGVRAVSGRGEKFVAGGSVIKNVTGYDLPKLLTGSWGRLAAMTEITLKVSPLPETSVTYVILGLDAEGAVNAMACAMGSAASIDAAAHCPVFQSGDAATVFRMSGFEPSFKERSGILRAALAGCGAVEVYDDGVWDALCTLSFLPRDMPLWRFSVPAKGGAQVAAALRSYDARWAMDWAGGLVWAAVDAPADQIRALAERAGGHAMLVRATPENRTETPAFHPQQQSVASLEARVRRAFDPKSVFETGRF